MEGRLIRRLRTERGLTQDKFAERLGVGQGTVSRWERGIESPRPRYVAAIRDILLRDDEIRFRRRCLALVRQNFAAAALIDAKSSCRLSEISGLGIQHYRRKHGIDIRTQFGTTMESHANRLGVPERWTSLVESGLLKGDALAVRMAMNVRGQGHVTLYEPILDQGEVVALFAAVQCEVALPQNDKVSLERVDVLHADSPDQALCIFAGKRATFLDPFLN